MGDPGKAAPYVIRAKIVLLAAEGLSNDVIARCSSSEQSYSSQHFCSDPA